MRMRSFLVSLVLLALSLAAGAIVLAGPAVPPQAKAPATGSGGVLQSQEADTPGVVAELIECKRKEGVLSIKVRFRNTTNAAAFHRILAHREYDHIYVTAAGEKYFLLKDSEGVFLTNQADLGGSVAMHMAKGGSTVWWGKFPAPPADVKKINFTLPRVPPFDDIPITD